MWKTFLILSTFAQIFNPSSSAPIRPKFQNIQDFQHCLVTYLNTVGIIQFTNSQNDENSTINCENFHIDLKSSIENMYKLIRMNLLEALGDDSEAECMNEVFRYTKFMEYNVIATTAVQLQPNGFQELKNLLQISKNIFIYATMKCLISSDMISELFQHFSTQIQVDDEQFGCLIQHVSENQLMEDFIVKNLDEFLSKKLMENSEESFSPTHNRQQNLQQDNKNSTYNSAETATDLIGTNFNELTKVTTKSTQMTNLLDIPPTGSEIREVIVDLNENEVDFNAMEDQYTTTNYNLLHTESTLTSVSSTIPEQEDSVLINIKIANIIDFSTTESISNQKSVTPEIISTKLKKIDNTKELQALNDSTTIKPASMSSSNENDDIYFSDYQTISSRLETEPANDKELRFNQSKLKILVTEQTFPNSETPSTTERTSATENVDQPPNSNASTTEQFTKIPTAITNDDFTPTASLLKSEISTDYSSTSYEDSTITSTQNERNLSSFSEKFGSFAGQLKHTEDSGMAPKKVMILERPVVSNIQKIGKSKSKVTKEAEEVTGNVTNASSNEDDGIDGAEDEGAIEPVTVIFVSQYSDYSNESTESDDEDNYRQDSIDEMTKVAKDFMEPNETVQISQASVENQESSTKFVEIAQHEENSLKTESKVAVDSSKVSQEVTELAKSYENVSETSKTSRETTEKLEEFLEEKQSYERVSKMPEEATRFDSNETKDENYEQKNTTASERHSVIDDKVETSTKLRNSEESSNLEQESTESNNSQAMTLQTLKLEATTTETTDLESQKSATSPKTSTSEENVDYLINLNGKPFIITEATQVLEQNTEQLTTENPSNKHQNPHDTIKIGDKKGKIVFKITNLPKNFSKLAAKLLNDTKSVAKSDKNFAENSKNLENFNLKVLKVEDYWPTADNLTSKAYLNINNNPSHNNPETTTNSDNPQEALQSSSEVLQASSENSFQKLAKSLKERQHIQQSDLNIPSSRIARQISPKSSSCPSIIDNLSQRIKKYNLESMDEELIACMSQLVSPQDVNDYFVFIVLKKYGSTELQANEKNKKLMNMIMSFIGKYIECTDLYGFMEMAGFPQDDY